MHVQMKDVLGSLGAGLVSGMVSCVMLQPLDVVKTQVQLSQR